MLIIFILYIFLVINVTNDDGLDSEDSETLRSYLNKRNNDLNLAIRKFIY